MSESLRAVPSPDTERAGAPALAAACRWIGILSRVVDFARLPGARDISDAIWAMEVSLGMSGPIRHPSLTIEMRSERRSTSAMRWLMYTMPIPAALS
jgi:hypothetical protein